MNRDRWAVIERCARGESLGVPPVALIVDSPWIPGFLGISTLDYLTIPDVFLHANLAVEREFPDVTFLPGFWVEAGMAAEPSGFGCKVSLFADKTPAVHPLVGGVEELDRIQPPNPHSDGWMPVILNYYRWLQPRAEDAGHPIVMVAARGPLTVASHLMGVGNFLVGLKLYPTETHRLLRITTTLVRDWLEAQAEALRSIEAIMVLDDIAGFLSPQDYLTFGGPYLQEIFAAFPGLVKFFHNDTENPASFPYLRELGIDVFNFTHLRPLAKVRELVGPDICLMGNVPPLDVLARGTPDSVTEAARECLREHPGPRLILSAGGGTSPGTPGANIRALAAAVRP